MRISSLNPREKGFVAFDTSRDFIESSSIYQVEQSSHMDLTYTQTGWYKDLVSVITPMCEVFLSSKSSNLWGINEELFSFSKSSWSFSTNSQRIRGVGF